MYLSRSNLLYARIMAFLQIGFGGMFTAVLLIAVLLSVMGSEAMTDSTGFYVAVLCVFAGILVLGINNCIQIGRANRFNSLFQGDTDGTLSVRQTAVLFHMPPRRCLKQFDALIRRGYLVNCHLEQDGEPVIILHHKPSQKEYLAKGKTLFMNILAFCLIGFSGFLLFFAAMSFLMVLFGDMRLWEDEHAPVWISIAVVFGSIMALALKIRGDVGRAYRFNSLFSGDRDGVISIAKTAALLGMPEHRLAGQFDHLLRQGYLRYCRLSAEPEPQIILNNGAVTVRERFVTVICPGCGGSNTLKAGFIGKCRFCDRDIQV